MARFVLGVVAALALVLVEAPGTGAQSSGGSPMQPAEDVAPRIVNGVLTSLYPTTGALLFPSNPNTAGLVCTGTLIGCQTFLTAAHCVADLPNPSAYLVFLQHAGLFNVASIAIHPDFGRADDGTGDLAVIRLATPVTGIAPTRINTTAAPSSGTPGVITGFGRSGGTSADYGIKRTGSVRTATCTAGVSNTTSVCWNFTSPLGAPGSNSNTCNGDSGGPLFIDFGSGDRLAGVTSGGTSNNCLPNDLSFDANVFFYRSWIQQQGGADLNRTACGDLPQVGGADTSVLAASDRLSSGRPQATHSFSVPSGINPLRVAMNAVDDGSNFDLYVKAGAPPTTSDFDCRRDGASQYGFCEFNAPASGTWHVLVNRVSGSGTYQVTVTTFGAGCADPANNGKPCDDGSACTQNDTCQAGACVGTPFPAGTPCDDGKPCTHGDACQAGVCSGSDAPLAGCRQPFVSNRASLLLKDHATNDARDKLDWKWVRGSATSRADFGDPLTSTNYVLCVYDETVGADDAIMAHEIPPGANWTATRKGFKYRDRELIHDGISQVQLQEGADGRAKIVVKGKGGDLRMAALPLNQERAVTVQLSNGSRCWEAVYTTSTRNDSGQFKSKAD